MKSSLCLLLLSFSVHRLKCQSMESIESTVQKKPGETLTLSCRGSGFSFDCCGMHWIRQQAGKPLVWIGRVYSDGSGHDYAEAFNRRTEITRDNSKNMVYLKLSGLTTEDSDTYYCARNGRWVGNYAFDYWGKGTTVTVSSAQPSAPKSIFALSQCSPDSDGFLTIGCVTRGFSPVDSLTFKWKDHTEKELHTFIQYPAFGSDGDYTKISHLRVKKSDWDPQNPYTCEASNLKGTVKTIVDLPNASPAKFTLTLKPPVERELFVNNKVVLEAVVSGDVEKTVQEASVSCEVKNGNVRMEPGNVSFSNDISQFIKIHSVKVDTDKWFNGETVTCTIRDRNIKEVINFNKGDEKEPIVTIYRPDIINKDSVSLVCEVTSPKLGDVYIMWKVREEPYIEATTSVPVHQKSSTSVLSILTVSKQEYEDPRTTISCAVKHANMDNISTPLQVATSPSKQSECPVCNKD